jgi:hypothetical protein
LRFASVNQLARDETSQGEATEARLMLRLRDIRKPTFTHCARTAAVPLGAQQLRIWLITNLTHDKIVRVTTCTRIE